MNNRLFLLILKEKKLIAITSLIGFALFVCYLCFCYVPTYLTTAKLFVRNIPQNDIVTNYNGGSVVKSESGFSNPLFNLTHILKSEELADSVYDKLINNKEYSEDIKKLGIKSKNDWVAIFPSLISSKIEPSSDIIQVSFNWVDGKNASPILGEIITDFKSFNINISKAIEIKQREYLEKQLKLISNDLTKVRNQTRNYKLKNKVMDIDSETIELTRASVDLQKQLEMLNGQIAFNDKKLRSYSSQLGFRNADLALRATGIGNDSYLLKLNQDLAAAQQNLANLSANFTGKYPDVLSAKNEIDTIKQNIENRQTETLKSFKIPRGIYDKPSQDLVSDLSRVQAETTSLKAQKRLLISGINNLTNKGLSMPSKLLGLNELKKQEDSLLTAYTNARQKLLEATIKENQIVDNIVLLDKPSSPEYMQKILIMKLLGFMLLGFLSGVAIAWVKEDIEDKWFNSSEIEEITNKKVLGVLPWLTNISNTKFNYIHEHDSIMGVAFADISNNLISKSYLEEVQSIAFISTAPASNGKSSIVPNLCNVIARSNNKVILVDTDFQNPNKLLQELNIPYQAELDFIDVITEINKLFRLKKSFDDNVIKELLSKAIVPVDIVIDNQIESSFFYLCANKPVNNMYDYLASRGFKSIIEVLKNQHDFVLVDAPSKHFIFPEISAVIDSADSAVLISSMDTNRAELIKVINKIDKMEKKTLGIIPRSENTELEKQFNSMKTLEMDNKVKV